MPTKPRPSTPEPAQVGAFEAKTRFGELLARVVQGGEAVTITRRGVPVAKLVPITNDVPDPARVLARFQTFQEAHALEDVSTRELVDEGRR